MSGDGETVETAEQLLAEMGSKYGDSPLDAGKMEPDLQLFLQLVQRSPTERPVFVAMFIEMLSGHRWAPEWLMAYCMRVLRWPEVHIAAEAELRKSLPSTHSTAWEVLEAYDDDEEWAGRLLFKHVK